jgi:hypothetical protein
MNENKILDYCIHISYSTCLTRLFLEAGSGSALHENLDQDSPTIKKIMSFTESKCASGSKFTNYADPQH